MFGFPFHCIASTKETFPKKWLQEIKNKQKGGVLKDNHPLKELINNGKRRN